MRFDTVHFYLLPPFSRRCPRLFLRGHSTYQTVFAADPNGGEGIQSKQRGRHEEGIEIRHDFDSVYTDQQSPSRSWPLALFAARRHGPPAIPLQRMPHDRDAEGTKQVTPPVIPALSEDADPTGAISTLQPGGPTTTSTNAFFQDIGSNGRTCFSCHQPQSGWGMSASSIRDTFSDSHGKAPIFRPVDGAVCPTADVSGLDAKRKAYRLLLDKGLIRINIVFPADAEFSIPTVADSYGCNTNPSTGLTSPTTGFVSTYRRPLPSTNLGFINAIMWDGREPSLESQATDATNGHAQAATPPTPAQVAQIVAFETGLLTGEACGQARCQRRNRRTGWIAGDAGGVLPGDQRPAWR